MAICPHTGITVPECSCSVCLETQLRLHRPGAQGIPESRPAGDRAKGSGSRHRKAA